jgi:hypothetical protein
MKRKKPNPNECFHCGKPVGAGQPQSIRWDFSDVVYCDRACWDARREEQEKLRLWITAIHEAGHCLGARLGGRCIAKATIVPGKKFDGCVHSEHDISKPVVSTYVIEEWLLGHAAEVEFGFTGSIGHGWDYDHVVEMLKVPIKSAKSTAWSERTGIWGKVGNHKHAPYSTWDIRPRYSYVNGKQVNHVKDWLKSVRVTKAEWNPEFDKRVRKARRLAKKYREWIERVAKLLLANRTLTDKDIPPL